MGMGMGMGTRTVGMGTEPMGTGGDGGQVCGDRVGMGKGTTVTIGDGDELFTHAALYYIQNLAAHSRTCCYTHH